MAQISTSQMKIHQATDRINALLLSKRNEHGWWTGKLSTSVLSTATAVMALHKAVQATRDDAQQRRWLSLIDGGLKWLAEHQNADGGWGDTVLSISNIDHNAGPCGVSSNICRTAFSGRPDHDGW